MKHPHLTYGGLIAEDEVRSTNPILSPPPIDAERLTTPRHKQIVLRETTATGVVVVGSVRSSLVDKPIRHMLGPTSAFGPRFNTTVLGVAYSALTGISNMRGDALLRKKPVKTTTPKEILEHDVHVRLPPIDEWTAQARVVDIEDAKPFRVERENTR